MSRERVASELFKVAALHHFWRATLISCEKLAPGPAKFDFATRLGVPHASFVGAEVEVDLQANSCANYIVQIVKGASRSWLHVDGVVDVVDDVADVASDSRWNFWYWCRKDGVEDVGDVEDVVT